MGNMGIDTTKYLRGPTPPYTSSPDLMFLAPNDVITQRNAVLHDTIDKLIRARPNQAIWKWLQEYTNAKILDIDQLKILTA